MMAEKIQISDKGHVLKIDNSKYAEVLAINFYNLNHFMEENEIGIRRMFSS